MSAIETDGWVMKKHVANLCKDCTWKTEQGAMATCSVYEEAWPNARKCHEYSKKEYE